MADLYRAIPLPDTWPATPTTARKPSPFGANWGGPLTVEAFARELAALAGVHDIIPATLTDEDTLKLWLRKARAKHHPDAGGHADTFARIGWLARGLGL